MIGLVKGIQIRTERFSVETNLFLNESESRILFVIQEIFESESESYS